MMKNDVKISNKSSEQSGILVITQKRKVNNLLTYSLLFTFIALITFCTFIRSHRTLVSFGDGFNQYYPTFVYTGRYLRNLVSNLLTYGEIPLYDFSIGFGDDIIGTLGYYGFGDAFSFFSALFPAKYSAYGFSLVLVFKLYLAGLSFLYYCYKSGYKKWISIVGALAYAFCIFGIGTGTLFYAFINVMVTLPIWLLGIEIQINSRSRNINLYIIFSIFLESLSGFYFLYMITIFGALYFVVKYVFVNGKSVIGFLCEAAKIMLNYCIGFCMAGIIVLPQIYSFLHSQRQGDVSGISNYLLELPNLSTVESEFANLSFPNGLCLTLLAVFSIIILFCRKKKNLDCKILIIVLIFGTIFPGFGSVMSGFSFSTNRWVFILFFMIYSVTVKLLSDDSLRITQKESVIMALSVGMMFIMNISNNSITKTNTYSDEVFRICIMCILSVGTIILLASVYSPSSVTDNKKRVALAVISITNITFCSYLFFAQSIGGYYGEWNFKGKTDDEVSASTFNTIAGQKQVEDQFSRIDIYDSSLGSSIILNAPSTTSYYSISNSYLYDFFLKAQISPGVRGERWCLKGLDSRASLEMLLSVRKFANDENGTDIDSNNYFLPLGFAFTKTINEAQAEKVSGLTISDIMSDILILNSESTELGGIDKLTETYINLPKSTCMNGVNKENGKIYCNKNGEIILSPDISELNNAHTYEYYVLLSDMNYLDNKTEMNISINGKSIQLKGINVNYKVDSDDYLVKLKNDGKVCISFPEEGVFSLSNIQLLAIDITDYQNCFISHSRDVLKNTKIECNSVSGEFTASENEYLFFSIPYSEGWECTIDGEACRTIRTDYAFTSIYVTKGIHEIELHYYSPWHNVGIIMSVLGFGTFISYLVCSRKNVFMLKERNGRVC